MCSKRLPKHECIIIAISERTVSSPTDGMIDLGAAYKNIVDGNVNQLYKIANKAHNHEPGANSAADLNEF